MNQLIYRKSSKFFINEDLLSPKAKRQDIILGLYAAIYEEFKGASINKKYKDLNSLKKMDKINEFAHNWLKERGLE